MGYYANGGGALIIKAENVPKVVDAVRKHFDWLEATDIDRIFEQFGFEIDFDGEEVSGAWYPENKWHDDDVSELFETIAPYVENKSYLDFSGEDGSHWRSSFFCGQYIETQGYVTYPGDPYDEPGAGAPLG